MLNGYGVPTEYAEELPTVIPGTVRKTTGPAVNGWILQHLTHIIFSHFLNANSHFARLMTVFPKFMKDVWHWILKNR